MKKMTEQSLRRMIRGLIRESFATKYYSDAELDELDIVQGNDGEWYSEVTGEIFNMSPERYREQRDLALAQQNQDRAARELDVPADIDPIDLYDSASPEFDEVKGQDAYEAGLDYGRDRGSEQISTAADDRDAYDLRAELAGDASDLARSMFADDEFELYVDVIADGIRDGVSQAWDEHQKKTQSSHAKSASPESETWSNQWPIDAQWGDLPGGGRR